MRRSITAGVFVSTLALVAPVATATSAGAAVTAASAQVAFTVVSGTGEGSDIFVQRRDGSGTKRLTSGGISSDAAWSPDGATLAYNRGSDIWLMTAAGQNIRRVMGNASGASWSGNGAKLAFARNGRISTVALAGGTATLLTVPSAACRDSAPEWSPTSDLILFVRSCAGEPKRVKTVSATTRASKLVTRDGAKGAKDVVMSPAWMPDGRSITFTANCVAVGKCTNVRNVMVADLNDSRRAVTSETDNCDPRQEDCFVGYFDVAAGSTGTGTDFAVSWNTPSGAAAPCISTLNSNMIYCEFMAWEVKQPSFQPIG